MKTLIFLPLLLIVTICIAQPQWKFHIAFEDATGAKDTIWLIWDTTAHGTTPIDTALGEGPVNFVYNEFNVWIRNWNWDSTKTVAYPYNAISFLIEVRAFNHQLPITIRWDSSLFHAPYLPMPVGYINRATIGNDYFFGVNNDPFLQAFNMLLDNNALAPSFNWGSQSQFPMEFFVARDQTISIIEPKKINIMIYPNPFQNEILFKTKSSIKSIEILSTIGEGVYSKIIDANNSVIKIETEKFPTGLYILEIINHQNQFYYEKIIKF